MVSKRVHFFFEGCNLFIRLCGWVEVNKLFTYGILDTLGYCDCFKEESYDAGHLRLFHSSCSHGWCTNANSARVHSRLVTDY